jgi:Na+/H+ antiporter NhaD/arsenite permease-like protein
VEKEILALIIVSISLILISIGRVKQLNISRTAAALLGGLLMIFFGIIPIDDLFSIVSQNLSTILLLVGMMLIGASLEISGFFTYVTSKIMSRSSSAKSYFISLSIVVALLSALILNDVVVILITPLVIKIAKAKGYNPIPYALAVIFAANIGSAATINGNPQNVLIGTFPSAVSLGISYSYFIEKMAPIAILSLVGMVIYMIIFSKLEGQKKENPKDDIQTKINPYAITLSLSILTMAIITFFFDSVLSASIGVISFFYGSLALIVVPMVAKKDPEVLIKKVDWNIILFFIGLFIILDGVIRSNMMSLFLVYIPQKSTSNIVVLTSITTIFSTLISNVPSVILLLYMISPTKINYLTLSASSTLGGNATFISAVANIIVLEKAQKEGVKISFKEFIKYGIPITLISLVIAATLLYIGY